MWSLADCFDEGLMPIDLFESGLEACFAWLDGLHTIKCFIEAQAIAF